MAMGHRDSFADLRRRLSDTWHGMPIFGIGMRVSSGCIRLRDGDIETLFRQVAGNQSEYYQYAD